MQNEINTEIYYNSQPLESFNSLFNFIIGDRGKGKTYYYAKKRVIDRFLNNKIEISKGKFQGEQFIYLRRHKNELKTLSTFFDDIRSEYPELKLEVKNRVFYCNNEVMGYAIQLSTANMLKSTAYPYVQSIIFDEFILEKGYIRYMENEVNVFLNFYETVARLRENVKVFFLGNAVSLVNPYFVFWNIMPNVKNRFTKVKKALRNDNKGRHLILVEILQDDTINQNANNEVVSYREVKANTDFAEIVSGTDYDRQANQNEFVYDTDDFIEKKTANSKFLYTIVYMNEMYGVWLDALVGKLYVSRKLDKNTKKVYAITTEDFKVNMFLVDNLKNFNGLMIMRKSFVNGYLMFENLQIKSAMFEMMKLFGC